MHPPPSSFVPDTWPWTSVPEVMPSTAEERGGVEGYAPRLFSGAGIHVAVTSTPTSLRSWVRNRS